jgi:hypothetical protein
MNRTKDNSGHRGNRKLTIDCDCEKRKWRGVCCLFPLQRLSSLSCVKFSTEDIACRLSLISTNKEGLALSFRELSNVHSVIAV